MQARRAARFCLSNPRACVFDPALGDLAHSSSGGQAEGCCQSMAPKVDEYKLILVICRGHTCCLVAELCVHACLDATYFTEVWVNREETSLDSEIFSDLPSSLRAKVAQYVTTDLVLQDWKDWKDCLLTMAMDLLVGSVALPKMHVLRDQESGLQELIAQHLRPVDVTPGHDVCRQGEEGDRLWICAEGDLVAVQESAKCHGPRHAWSASGPWRGSMQTGSLLPCTDACAAPNGAPVPEHTLHVWREHHPGRQPPSLPPQALDCAYHGCGAAVGAQGHRPVAHHAHVSAAARCECAKQGCIVAVVGAQCHRPVAHHVHVSAAAHRVLTVKEGKGLARSLWLGGGRTVRESDWEYLLRR
eukprot:scaffold127278_cov17-Tisochrysis_lutea.AAC.1